MRQEAKALTALSICSELCSDEMKNRKRLELIGTPGYMMGDAFIPALSIFSIIRPAALTEPTITETTPRPMLTPVSKPFERH